MPIGTTYRVNPIDLQPNTAVGVGLPFNGPAVFNTVYNTNEQIKYNLINFLLTNKGERILNPEFGSDIRKYLFEIIDNDSIDDLNIIISDGISKYVPEAEVVNLEITSNPDEHVVSIKLTYKSRLNGNQDNITIEFN